ncbi:MAG: DUF488 domain-containing protein [Bacteroidales bacterium]|nr:DUF488 domain-containing protein [Bacteroidales bacterium]MCF8333798.1 DUF488 domain-containing protein [Bacteroidales bacterium]
MYYRRKILLSLLETFTGGLEKIRLQKLLFLLVRKQEKPSFHFVPYKYGCFSFQANADLHTLTKYNLVESDDKNWSITSDTPYFTELTNKDQEAVKALKQEYQNVATEELIRTTYVSYPYFAINSTIAPKILEPDQLEKVNDQKRTKTNTTLFTIGYEGISLEQYLNKLIVNDVKVLCDVRKNPLSMKYGFSKNQLKNACEGVGIQYKHIPDVGIVSDKRQQLNKQSDYDRLFEYYKSDVLMDTTKQQLEIVGLLKKHYRVALTCFEANIHQCHRKPLADSVAQQPGFEYEVKHI